MRVSGAATLIPFVLLLAVVVLLALLAVFSISSVIVFFPDAIRLPGPSSRPRLPPR